MGRKHTLGELAKAIGGELVGASDPALEIATLVSSGKHAERDSLFFALRGEKVDGHRFVEQAISSGSSAVVVEQRNAAGDHPAIFVKDTRVALSRCAAYCAGDPSRDLSVIGVTGTNGKTTTVWLLTQLLRNAGSATLRMGTLGSELPGVIEEGEGTLNTSEPIALNRTLERARSAGCRFVALEASSHGLDQCRVDDLHFDVAIFTNLTRDHLDYHKDMEHYYQAKKKLFVLLDRSEKKKKCAVINCDDPYGERLAEEVQGRSFEVIRFGRGSQNECQIISSTQDFKLLTVQCVFKGRTLTLHSSLIGEYNSSNITGVLCSAVALGLDLDTVVKELAALTPAPGRLDRVLVEEVGVYVDYAHTPDALENVLKTLKLLCRGKLWVLFGCGGDRDRGKRPLMGEIAARYADRVIVTSDNPRTEDPVQIIQDILSSGIVPHVVELDRRKAIESVAKEARAGDVVLIAGKGHEPYQIIGTTKHHFSDKEEAERAFKVQDK